MGGDSVLPGWDTFVLVVPILGLLAMMMFGLDERCAGPTRRQGSRRFFCQVDGTGSSCLSDPDGTPWQKRGARPVKARLIQMNGPGRQAFWPENAAAPVIAPAIRGYIVESK